MNSIFSDLLKYGPTEGSTPIENFTTEIFKYLLRVDDEILRFILIACDKESYMGSKLRIDSQVDIGKGPVDILITDDCSFGIVIENKIDASFQDKQIRRYKECAELRWSKNNCILALTKNIYEFDEKIGKPDHTLYWSDVAEFIDKQHSKPKSQLLDNFFNFLKEGKMALNKVKWNLVEGMEEKENLIHMLRVVLDKFVGDGMLVKKPGKKESTGKGWDVFSYEVPATKEKTDIVFNNSDATLYFRIEDKGNKYAKLERCPISKNHKILGKLDFKILHFFPLEATEQMNVLSKFIVDAVAKIKDL